MPAIKIGSKRRTTDIATSKMPDTECIGQGFHCLTSCGREEGGRNKTLTSGMHPEVAKHEGGIAKFLQLPTDDFGLGLFCRLVRGNNLHCCLHALGFRTEQITLFLLYECK